MELLNVQIPSILECKYCGTNSEEVPTFFTLFKGKLDCFCLALQHKDRREVRPLPVTLPERREEMAPSEAERPLPSRELRDG